MTDVLDPTQPDLKLNEIKLSLNLEYCSMLKMRGPCGMCWLQIILGCRDVFITQNLYLNQLNCYFAGSFKVISGHRPLLRCDLTASIGLNDAIFISDRKYS